MLPLILAITGGAAGVVVARDRQRRSVAERLAAATLETLLNAIDANDAVTGAHVRRVAAYALALADAAGLDAETRRSVERVALFHDVGKMHEALFDIIHDDDALDEAERAAIRTHPARGAEVLEPLAAFYPDLAPGVLAHHERWDGSGYPHGLGGTQIPLAARIVAIADTFDAVTASRRYRTGGGMSRALEVIAAGRGVEFDPALVDLFLLPPVQECVRRVAEQSRHTPARRSDRRHREVESAVPDVRFRWRDALRVD